MKNFDYFVFAMIEAVKDFEAVVDFLLSHKARPVPGGFMITLPSISAVSIPELDLPEGLIVDIAEAAQI